MIREATALHSPRPILRAVAGKHCRRAMAVLALLLFSAATAGSKERQERLWVEVRNEKGQWPEGLIAADLEVAEGGREVALAGLGPRLADGPAARFVLYFDQTLAGSRTIKLAAEGLSSLASDLSRLGEVEIVMAGDEGPETVLRSHDELILGERLARAALTDTGELEILEIRRRALRELGRSLPFPAPEEIARIVTDAVVEEIELVRQRWEELLVRVLEVREEAVDDGVESDGTNGLRTVPTAGPQVLVVMLDGFDLDPLEFYTGHLEGEALRTVARSAARLPTLDTEIDELARTLAAAGWTVFPVSFPAAEGEQPGLEYSAVESAEETAPGDREGITSAPGFTVRPGSLFRRRQVEGPEGEAPEAVLVQPLKPLRLLADETGGELLSSGPALRDALERLAGRVELIYRSDLEIDGRSRSLEVRPQRPGWTVQSRRWLARGIPEAVAGVRLRRLLAGFEGDGGLELAAVLQLDEPTGDEEPSTGTLEARLDLHDLEAAAPVGRPPVEERTGFDDADFRVSVAIATEGGEIPIRSEIFTGQDLRQRREWQYKTDLELPAGATEVAVLIEELGRGHWGGRRATVVQGDWADAGDLLPAPAVIEIRRPDQELLRGRIKFETDVYDPQVAAVDFLLDDREIAHQTWPPYAARIDLGRIPRRRELTVIAFDRAGTELGRNSVILNGGSGGLAVDIVSPHPARGTGLVEVEAEIAVPVERRLDRVLFFWNNQPVATLYGPPFRQRVDVPAQKPAGYVRVVAMLDDGTTSEDVIFMNGPAASDRLEVNLVELYVVVTDENGRPVRGLTEIDFRVREDGREQEIATFSDASDLPLTLGMAIDSSASMFVKLPSIQRAAIDFLHSTFSKQDRAFVVDFDTEPRLARATTASMDRLQQSIAGLEANGRTALWESIVFSLVQLQGVRGRKALIVFSDGADEDDQFPFGSAMDIAKKVGVPIYLILMKKEPRQSVGLSLFTRSFSSRINRLVEATGGRAFYAREYDRLGDLYAEIEYELRCQYLLAYYPRDSASNRAWRDVDVNVARKGLQPRTLSGYWQ